MQKTSSKLFFLSSLLLLIAAVLIKFISINSFSIGGHDTFQYIHWADILFSEDRDLIFFRPFLYLIIYISLSLLSWSPEAFKIMLIFFWLGSFLMLILLLFRLRISYFLSSAVLLSFTFSRVWLEGDAVGHITSIETFFIILLLQFGLSLQKEKNALNYSCFFIVSMLLVLIHEEKIIYALALFFVLENNLVRTIKFSTILITFLALIYFLLGGQTSNENSLLIAGSVALGWGNHLYIFDNIWNTYSSSSKQFGFFESALLSGIMIYVAILWAKEFYYSYFIRNEIKSNESTMFLSILERIHNVLILKKAMAENIRLLILPSIIYFFITGIVFAGIDLPRTTTPVMLPVLIGSFMLLYNKNFSFLIKASALFLIFLGGLLNFYSAKDFIKKNDEFEERYSQAYSLLNGINYSCLSSGKVALDTSFENRPPMWGDSDNKYGLSSKVYMGSCAEKITLKNSNDLREFGAIVFYKDDLAEVQRYDEFERNLDWKKLSNKNVIIFLRR